MGKVIRLTESDLVKLVSRVIKEQTKDNCFAGYKFSNNMQSNIQGVSGKENYSKEDSNGNETILFKGLDWTKGRGVIVPRNIETVGKPKPISWFCSSGKLTIFDNNIK